MTKNQNRLSTIHTLRRYSDGPTAIQATEIITTISVVTCRIWETLLLPLEMAPTSKVGCTTTKKIGTTVNEPHPAKQFRGSDCHPSNPNHYNHFSRDLPYVGDCFVALGNGSNNVGSRMQNDRNILRSHSEGPTAIQATQIITKMSVVTCSMWRTVFCCPW